jgi:hypothetical protein
MITQAYGSAAGTGQEPTQGTIARARITLGAVQSTAEIFRHNGRPYHGAARIGHPVTKRYIGSAHNGIIVWFCRVQAFVTKVHSLAPIDSTVQRWGIRCSPGYNGSPMGNRV